MDSSNAATPIQFNSYIMAARTLIESLTINKDGAHIAFTRFADTVQDEFSLDDYMTQQEIIIAMTSNGRTSQFQQPPNTSKALQHVQLNSFTVTQGRRSNARKVVVLFSNGHFIEKEGVKTQANLLKDGGVVLVCIGVGRDADVTSLLEIASDPTFVYVVGDDVFTNMSVLSSLAGSLEFDVCEFD